MAGINFADPTLVRKSFANVWVGGKRRSNVEGRQRDLGGRVRRTK